MASSFAENLKIARKARGWSLERLAGLAGTSKGYLSDLERGARPMPPGRTVERLAQALQMDPDELLAARPLLGDGFGPGMGAGVGEALAPPPRPHGYPMIGKVGAGGSGDYADDYALGAAADEIEPLPGMDLLEDIIVLEVEGDSMSPAVFDGDLAFFGPVRRDVDQLINKRVMARLADGRKFFKILKRGSREGVYTLRSLNPATPDIEDVRVEWVLPYRGSRPRD